MTNTTPPTHRTMHLVSHTHWDREWYLTYQQFRLKLVHLVDNLLELLQEDPNYRYFMLDGQTIVLEDYLEIRPERRQELQQHIQTGRIQIGPWYILPDEFLVSPEALVRNLLEGLRQCRTWGPRMEVGYIPDPFGHIGQMPQILRGFGIESACLWRGLTDEPCEFWWRAPDGSQVFMAYLRESYSNCASLPTAESAQFTQAVLQAAEALAPHSSSSHLLLMHGTDHMEPPADTTAAIASFNRQVPAGWELRHSTLPAYLEAVQAELQNRSQALPGVCGELRSSRKAHLLPGVLSTRIWIKQRNHACQTLLEKWAEPFSAWASILDDDRQPRYRTAGRVGSPQGVLRQAWRLLLQCHPHDSICGCSIDPVHEEMRPRFDQVEQMGEAVTQQSLALLASQVSTLPPSQLSLPGRPVFGTLVVFNPLHCARSDSAWAEIQLPPDVTAFEIVDEGGQVLPYRVDGLGSQELMNVVMDSAGFHSAVSMVHNGHVAGMVVRSMAFSQQQDQVNVEVRLSQDGEPDLEAYQGAMHTIEKWLKDPAVHTFHVLARSVDAVRLNFTAGEVPGCGWRTFYLRQAPQAEAPQRLGWLARLLLPLAAPLSRLPVLEVALQRLSEPAARPPYAIQNEFLRVEADPRSGVLSLTDLRSGLELTGLNRFFDGGDCGDEYNYAPPSLDRLVTQTRLRGARLETHPACQRLHLELQMTLPAALSADRQGRSPAQVTMPIRVTASLYQGVPRLDIHTEIENLAQDHRLRVHFSSPFEAATASYDGHYEIVRRPTALPAFDATWAEDPRPEVPQRAFTAVEDPTGGLVIANRGLPEVEVQAHSQGSELALTLLRCVGWLSRDDFSTRRGNAGPSVATPGAQLPGWHSFDYALIPHAPGQGFAAALEAYAFNAGLRAVGQVTHPGTLPASGTFLSIEPAEFLLSTVKAADDGSGWIVRGYNPTRQELAVCVTPRLPYKTAQRVDLAEQLIETLPCGPEGIKIKVPALQILSLKFS